MNYLSYLIAVWAAGVAVGAPLEFSLKACAPGEPFDNYDVVALHESAALNYAFLQDAANGGDVFYFNDTSLLYPLMDTGQNPYYSYITQTPASGAYAVMNIGYVPDPSTKEPQRGYAFKDGALTLDGVNGFYACNNITDFYNYPYPGVCFYKPGVEIPANCTKIDLVQA